MDYTNIRLNKLGRIQNTILLLTFLAIASAIFYLIYIVRPEIVENPLLYILYLIGELFIITHSIFIWWTILHYSSPTNNSIEHEKLIQESKVKLKKHTIDVFVPVVSEDFNVYKETIKAVLAMDLPHKTYILDDKGRSELKKLAEELGTGYFHRGSNEYFKAGNINNAFRQTSGEFVVVFDADFVPHKDFLVKTIPYFKDSKLGLLQTPQYYKTGGTFAEEASAPIQNAFYELIMPGKNSFNSAFCVGTNVVYRRKALDEMGGIALVSDSEDVFTSYKLHELGWKSLYIPEVMAVGLAPDTIHGYFKQQARWAKGGFSMTLKNFPLLNKKLTLDQRIQYMSSTFYFSGFVIFLYLLFPIIYLLFGIRPINNLYTLDWFVHFLPFFLINFIMSAYALGGIRLKSMALAIATFPIYLKSFYDTLVNTKFIWQATNNVLTKRERNDYKPIYPHIIILSICMLAVIIGSINPIDRTATFINIFWVALYMGFIGTVVSHYIQEKGGKVNVKRYFKRNSKKAGPSLILTLEK